MFVLPEKCPRGLGCQPLAMIASDNDVSYYCCGENDGSDRSVKQDKYTLCFKNASIDQRMHNDKRDLTHKASVLMQALAIIEERDSEEYHLK